MLRMVSSSCARLAFISPFTSASSARCSSRAAAMLRHAQASSKGVQPLLLRLEGERPASRRACTASVLPRRAAMCRGCKKMAQVGANERSAAWGDD